jgi:hypothetical protein
VRTLHGRSGTISSPYWTADPIALEELSRPGFGSRFLGPATEVTADPTILGSAGSSFAVSWALFTPTVPTGGPTGRFFPGFGS